MFTHKVCSNGIAAVVIAIGRDGVALVKDPLWETPQWKFPGGKGVGNESPLDVAVRKLREETGVVPEPVELIHILEKKRFEGSENEHMFHVFGFKTGLYLGECAVGFEVWRTKGVELVKLVSRRFLETSIEVPNHKALFRDCNIRSFLE
ncbi:NUDIX domain-containing protein [Candidatus Kaiserbacteria bacterium]|nr:NUDIX domain-containing protein [Candidatus Kaiserbacteria bacterium]